MTRLFAAAERIRRLFIASRTGAVSPLSRSRPSSGLPAAYFNWGRYSVRVAAHGRRNASRADQIDVRPGAPVEAIAAMTGCPAPPVEAITLT